MPYPNEHACRIRAPGGLKEGSFRRFKRTIRGKSASFIGSKDSSGKFVVQAVRFPKAGWSAAQAKSVCRSMKGTFEAASGGNESAADEARGTMASMRRMIQNALHEHEDLFEDGHNHDDEVEETASYSYGPHSYLYVVDLMADEKTAIIGCSRCTDWDSGWRVKYSVSEDSKTVKLSSPRRIALQWVNEQETAVEGVNYMALDAELFDGLRIEYDEGLGEPLADEILWGEDAAIAKAQGEKSGEEAGKKNEALPLRSFLDVCETPFEVLDEGDGEGKPKRLRARVRVAQKGDEVNANGRVYPWPVLREAALRAQEKASRGELLMEAFHRLDTSGQNTRNLIQTVAKITRVGIDDASKTVSLDEVEFIPTAAGKDMMEVVRSVAENGGAMQVSQRGEGRATIVKLEGKPVQRVDALNIQGWDFVPPGDASVKEATVQLMERSGGNPMNDKDSIEGGGVTEGEQEATPPVEPTPAAPTPPVIPMPDVKAIVDEAIKPFAEKLDEAQKYVEAVKASEALRETVKTNEAAVQGLFEAAPAEGAENPYARFSEEERAALLDGMTFEGSAEDCQTRLNERVALFDRGRATAKLTAMGHAGAGVVRSPALPKDGDYYGQDHRILTEKVRRILETEGAFERQPGSASVVSKAIMGRFNESYGQRLLNEADGTASDVADPVYTYSAVVLEQALPQVKLLDIVDVGTMDSLLDVIWLETWSAALNADLASFQIAEGSTAPAVNMTLAKYIIYASAKKVRTSLTPENTAMARGIPGYDMIARTLAGLSKDLARRLDYHFAGVLVATSDAYAATKVTTNETLTQASSSTTWQSANRAWIENEYVRKLITADNYVLTRLNLVGTDFDGGVGNADAALQAIIVIDSSGTPKTLVRGWLQADGTVKTKAAADADYYVKHADGQVVLADSPVTSGLTAPYKAKYTYTRNTVLVDMTPGVGIKLNEHLLNVHQKVGQAKTVLVNRFWDGNMLAMSETVADLLSNSEKFTQAGGNIANAVRSDNSVGRFNGLPLFTSTAFNDEKILVGSRGVLKYRIQQPFALSEWVVDTNTGNRSAVGVEFSAVDVPQPVRSITVTLYNWPS